MKSVVGQLASPLFISDLEAETMKSQIFSPILAVIIMLAESIFAVSLAENIRFRENTVTLTGAEVIANSESDRTSESSNDADECDDPELVDCGAT